MNCKDVKKILDIPNIEDYLRTKFELDLYEVGDKTILYKYALPNKHTIWLELHSNETLIFGKLDLAGIIAHYDIGFFEWSEVNDLDDCISAFWYRPLIKESEKNY